MENPTFFFLQVFLYEARSGVGILQSPSVDELLGSGFFWDSKASVPGSLLLLDLTWSYSISLDLTWSHLILLDLTWSYLRMSVRCQKSPGPQSPQHFRTYCLAKCLFLLFSPLWCILVALRIWTTVKMTTATICVACNHHLSAHPWLSKGRLSFGVLEVTGFFTSCQLDLFHPFPHFTQFSKYI